MRRYIENFEFNHQKHTSYLICFLFHVKRFSLFCKVFGSFWRRLKTNRVRFWFFVLFLYGSCLHIGYFTKTNSVRFLQICAIQCWLFQSVIQMFNQSVLYLDIFSNSELFINYKTVPDCIYRQIRKRTQFVFTIGKTIGLISCSNFVLIHYI